MLNVTPTPPPPADDGEETTDEQPDDDRDDRDPQEAHDNPAGLEMPMQGDKPNETRFRRETMSALRNAETKKALDNIERSALSLCKVHGLTAYTKQQIMKRARECGAKLG